MLSAAIIGLGVLVALLLRQPISVDSLEGLLPGTVVSIEGVASEWRSASYGSSFVIDSVSAFCECSQSYEGVYVRVIGVVEKYPEQLRVKAFSVTPIYL